MNKRWQVILEITFDPITKEEPPHEALERAKRSLDAMLEKSPTINHYHILQQPKYVHEFD